MYICETVIKKGLFWIILGLYVILRLLFPPVELTGDSYGYACEIINGNLWNAHHIMHKFVIQDIWIILQPLHFFNNPLEFFILLHFASALGAIYVLKRILELRHWSWINVNLALIFLISGFAFMKYVGENEVYFYPILISLIGSLAFEKNKVYTAAIWLGIATLFHQIHIFWLIGLLFPREFKRLNAYFPLIVGLFIPVITYSVLGLATQTSLSQMLFQDVHAGLVQTVPDSKNTVFFAINMVRLFFQIHGDILLFWNLWNPYFSGISIVNIIFVGLGFIYFLREIKYQYDKSDWYKPYMIAFCLHAVFAWYSVGNIEFMVLLPFLFLLSLRNGNLLKPSLLLSVGLLVWNMGQWVLPMSKTHPNRLQDKMNISSAIIEQDLSGEVFRKAQTLVFTSNAAQLQNAYQYRYLLDSMRSDELADSISSLNRLRFVEYHQDSLKPNTYFLKFSHGRLNRSKLQFEDTLPNNLRNLKFTRLYRDTGMSGVLELYRISQLSDLQN